VRFVDTNVLLYLISAKPSESAKRRVAAGLLDGDDLALSVQVLQEFYVQATRPRPAPGRALHHTDACHLIESFLRFPVQEMTVALMRTALETARRYHISFWDASILEAARALGCSTVLSEDLADRQSYGSVKVVNPFRGL
jgi:predicted nucleic acid-binding protein